LDEKIDIDKDVKKTNLNNIFALFIHDMQKYVTNEILIEYIAFILFYRRALNEYGWKLLNAS